MTARFRFLSAPATISEALALSAVVAGELGLAERPVHAHGRDDGAFLEEGVRHLDGLLEEAAGIAAQVEDEALERAAVLRLHRLDGAEHLAMRGPGEPGEADVADALIEELGGHRLVGDEGADEVELLRLLRLAHDVDGNLGAGLPAHAIDGFL